MEIVRRPLHLASGFTRDDLASAIAAFRMHYNVAPARGICAPDVYARVAVLLEASVAAAHQHSTRLRFEGVPLVVGIVEPSSIVLEGEVDELKMGDW